MAGFPGAEAIGHVVHAAKGQKDLLAFLGVLIVAGGLLWSGKSVNDILIFAIALLATWVGLRWTLAKIHSRERLQEFRERAKLESLRVLANHGTKADIKGRPMVEDFWRLQ